MSLPPEWIQPLEYLGPTIHMSPYDTRFLEHNAQFLQHSGVPDIPWDEYFAKCPEQWNYALTYNGREALHLALAALRLSQVDELWIVTTSGGPYISSCVTKEVERFCRPSREQTERTRAVLLIHEFGYPLKELPRRFHFPVIEDCAYAFGSQDEAGKVGAYGDFVIYSLSKAFPLPFGGVLKSRRPVAAKSKLTDESARFLLHALKSYLPLSRDAFDKRRQNYRRYDEAFRRFRTALLPCHLQPFFPLSGAVVPHSYVVRIPDQWRAEAIKPMLQQRGIESSVFYGNGGYFLPLHQNLGRASIEYIVRNVVLALAEVQSATVCNRHGDT